MRTSNVGLICDCGYEFAGPGEFRRCEAFITVGGLSGVECPDCGQEWIINEFTAEGLRSYKVDTKHDLRDTPTLNGVPRPHLTWGD